MNFLKPAAEPLYFTDRYILVEQMNKRLYLHEEKKIPLVIETTCSFIACNIN